jgi:AcrR family transcriptional regulator
MINKKNSGLRERERIRRRKEILKSAKWVFAREGYERANLDKIADRCDLAKGTIYYHFKSKEGLFASVLELWWDELNSKVVGAMSASSTRATIEKIITDLLTLFKKDHDLMHIFIEKHHVIFDPKSDFTKSIHRKMHNLVNQICAIFRQAIEQGELRRFDPMILTFALIGFIKTYALNTDYSPDRAAKFFTSILFDNAQNYTEFHLENCPR